MSGVRVVSHRVHGQRVSRAALVAESRAALDDAGITSQLRAKYIASLARVVVRHPEPLFCQHQPEVREDLFGLTSWADAYDLVAQFLAEHNLELTRATVDVEMPVFKGRSASGIAGHLEELVSTSEHGDGPNGSAKRHTKRTRAKGKKKSDPASPNRVRRKAAKRGAKPQPAEADSP